MPHDLTDRLRAIQARQNTVLCIGLDPDPQRMPSHLFEGQTRAEAVVAFTRAIVEATAASACAFKLNVAFFEVLGRDGWDALVRAIDAIRQQPGDAIVIADAKRGDIGNTARFYAESVFEHLGCDACTVAPYMGRDAVLPFLAYPGKAAFVLARTSNPGAADFQERDCEGAPLYLRVAKQVAAWDAKAEGTAGLVVGATGIEAMADLRAACPTLPFLIPGVGAQGGDPTAVMQAAATDDGPVLINSSRSILYASSGRDFADAAAGQADALRRQLRRP